MSDRDSDNEDEQDDEQDNYETHSDTHADNFDNDTQTQTAKTWAQIAATTNTITQLPYSANDIIADDEW